MNEYLFFEFKRKFVHILLTFYPLLFVYFDMPKTMSLFYSALYFTLWMASEYLRVNQNWKTPSATLLDFASRTIANGKKGKNWKRIRFPHWIVGNTITLLLFDYTILLAATIVLVFGDSASGLIRKLLKTENKLLGYFSGGITSFTLIYSITGLFSLSLLSSGIGMLSEFIEGINDNLTASPLAGIGGYLSYLK